MLYCLESFEICPDLPVFFSKLILGVILGENVKGVGITSGKDRTDKKLRFEI